MNTAVFNKIYEQAKTVDIVNNDYLNFAGFFWINLTMLQVRKMYTLMLAQGNQEQQDERGRYISLRNGCRIYNPITLDPEPTP